METFGPYELLRRLGTGGQAEVFLAAGPNPAGADLFALKIVLPQLAEDERVKRVLAKELETTRRLHHPNVVEVYEVGEAEGRPFMAMEFVRGWPLSALVKRLREGGKAITLAEACSLVREAALGLDHAHEARGQEGRLLGLVHRDVSPQNLLVREDGHLKVVDFGLAKATLAAGTHTGSVKGKLAYMPPEQIEGKPLDRRVDVFAAGAVLWELLCGQKLYPGRSEAEILQQALYRPLPRPDRLVPGLPRELVDVLQQALERDPSKRLPSCGVLADVLQPFTAPETPRRLAARVSGLFEPWPQKRPDRPSKAAALPESTLRVPMPHPPGGDGQSQETILAPSPYASGEELSQETTLSPMPPAPEDGGRGEGPTDPGPPLGGETIRASAPLTGLPERKRAAGRDAPRRPRPPDPRPRVAGDGREVLLHPLLASRPAEFRPRISDEATGTDYRIGVSSEISVSRLHPKRPPPRRAGVIGGALVALAILGLAVFAFRHVPKAELPPLDPAPAAAQPAPEPERPKKPTRGKVILQSDVPAFVELGGHEVGMTPLTLTLPAGTARVTLRTADGTLRSEVVVQVPAGGEVTRKVQLAP